MTGTLTFGTSLHTLVSHPALYGWNWNDEILTNGGGGNIPLPHRARAARSRPRRRRVERRLLRFAADRRPDRADHRHANPNATVQPPILTGHGLRGDRSDRARRRRRSPQLHKHVGDTVEASYGDSAPDPAAHRRHRDDARGRSRRPAAPLDGNRRAGRVPAASVPGPQQRRAARARPHVRAERDLRAPAPRREPGGRARDAATRGRARRATDASVVSVQRPAEIVNYRSMGSTPALLGAALAVGAVSALALTLIASVRRRRRDLALLKTLGFTRRQLAARGRVAVDDRGRHRRRRRRAARHRRRPLAVGSLRARAPRRAPAERARVDDPRSSRSARSCSPTSSPRSPAARPRARPPRSCSRASSVRVASLRRPRSAGTSRTRCGRRRRCRCGRPAASTSAAAARAPGTRRARAEYARFQSSLVTSTAVCGACTSGLSSAGHSPVADARRSRPGSRSSRRRSGRARPRSSDSVGSIISVPATGNDIVGAWKP